MTRVRRGISWAHVVASPPPSVDEVVPVALADTTQILTVATEEAKPTVPESSNEELLQELHNVTSESITAAVSEGNQGSRVVVEKARQLYLQLVLRQVPVMDIMNVLLNAMKQPLRVYIFYFLT